MALFASTLAFISLAVHLAWTAEYIPHGYNSTEALIGRPSARIINGDFAESGEFPSQVSILLHGIHSFGGSIVSYKWIMTTARVARGHPDDYTVLVGTNTINNGGTFHRVKEVLPHLLYNGSGDLANDLAMLRLRDPITLGNNSQVVPLFEGQLTQGVKGVVVGWGWYLQGNAGFSNHLRKATIQISNRDKCNFAYSEFGISIQPTQACAEDPHGISGPCGGDAGGAFLVDGKIAGITSWSLGCVLEGYPNVMTDVSKYVQWIRKIIECHP